MNNLLDTVSTICAWCAENPKLTLLALVTTLILCSILSWILGDLTALVSVKIYSIRRLSKDAFEIDIETPFIKRMEVIDLCGKEENSNEVDGNNGDVND